MKAIKGNKEYDIDEKQKNSYLESGYDIKNDKGEVIAYGRGKTVPYEKYEALEEENKVLKEKIIELEKAHFARYFQNLYRFFCFLTNRNPQGWLHIQFFEIFKNSHRPTRHSIVAGR